MLKNKFLTLNIQIVEKRWIYQKNIPRHLRFSLIRKISKKISVDARKQYSTIFSVGICLEETMQHLQDSAVRTNVLYGLDMWVSINQMQMEKIKKLRELGLLDVCDIPYMPKNKKDELRIIELMKKEGLMDE